jgi:hypothetical protein
MDNKELKDFIKLLEEYKRKPVTKESATKFLVDIGVITEKGNLRKNYKNLCIPQEQA